jgi:hypothetical protein
VADNVGREELKLALKLATSFERADLSSEVLSSHEAEQIALEVGLPLDEFRGALAEARSSRLGRGKWLGPSPLLSAEASVSRPATAREAARAIAEGQAGLPQIAQGAEEVAPGIWRSSSRSSLLQVASDPLRTRVSAAANRGVFKAATILGTTGAGGFIGSQLGGLLSLMSAVGSPSAMAAGIGLGAVGGLVSGFVAGVSLWKASARSSQARLYQAVDRMRDALSPGADKESGDASEAGAPSIGDT